MPGEGCFEFVYHRCEVCPARNICCCSLQWWDSHHRSKCATVCHGLSGILWLIMGSFVLEGRCSREVGHFPTISSICLLIPGQNNMSQTLCLYFSIPMWPAWIHDNISQWAGNGDFLTNMIPFICDSSFPLFQNSDMFWGHLLLS